MGSVIFLTGGTGIHREPGRGTAAATIRPIELFVLVLAPDGAPEGLTPERVLARSWWDMPDLASRIGQNVSADLRRRAIGRPRDGRRRSW